ncbi:lipoate--protein ligase [uncultured Dysosmobacter sp.]|uniref:lipoate--protein ligase n=1 Tax=uncultured Dysosmobacter sp. TaxID=2591384 RepID=UPI002632846A|nr:lipoate--protein ligase [uncultured Dysosmobacter sp.]
MAQQVTYLETRSLNPFYNLAFEEYVLTYRRQGEYLLLWQNDNTIVIGQNQNAEAEINRAFVEERKIRVARRTTGGGAVYHDLGNLNYSFITDAGDAEKLTMERFTLPVVNALRALGLEAEASGRNDILVEGKKVSGTAQRLLNGRILHHGTLLFDADPDMVSKALHVEPEKFRSKSAKSVRSRIGNIRDFLQDDMELREFWEYLKRALIAGDLTEDSLTTSELAEVERLKREKYDTWEWNFGRSPQYDMANKRRWNGGSLEVRAAVEKGRITSVAFYGDFLSRCPMDGLADAMRGCAFRQEDVRAVLARYPLRDYFGEITEDEILETMFHVHE